MGVQFDRSSGSPSSPVGGGISVMPRLHRARLRSKDGHANQSAAVCGGAFGAKHVFAGRHCAGAASRRAKAQGASAVCAAQ